MSARLWRVAPRGKLYGGVLLVILASIATAFFGKDAIVHYSIVWILIFGILLGLFKTEAAQLLVFLRVKSSTPVEKIIGLDLNNGKK